MASKILVIDDDADITRCLKVLLGGAGYEINTAANGRAALDFLNGQDELPDVILLDLMMPGMDGVAFRVEQQKNPRLMQIPVVLMTADPNYKPKTENMGIRAFLTKPFTDLECILETVKLAETVA